MRPVPIYLAAVAAIMVTACGSNVDENRSKSDGVSNFVIDETIKTASQSYAYIAEGDTTYLTLSTSLMWPEKLGDSRLATLQDSIIAGMFPGVKSGRGVDGAIRHFISDPSVVEFGDFKAVDSLQSGMAAEMAWYVDITGKFIELNEQVATYQITSTSYAGGAHPNSSTRYFSYDLGRGRVFTVANMFKPGSEAKLLEAIKEALAYQLGTTVDGLGNAGIFVDQLSDIGNPYLTEDAVVFHYNPYEIAPYSMGPVDVTIWSTEIEQYLTPEVIELLRN